MNDGFEEHNGLLDDDPALDFILYEEMRKDENKGPPPKGNGGCLSLIVLAVLPTAGTLLWVI